jgi:hypothetical protein
VSSAKYWCFKAGEDELFGSEDEGFTVLQNYDYSPF